LGGVVEIPEVQGGNKAHMSWYDIVRGYNTSLAIYRAARAVTVSVIQISGVHVHIIFLRGSFEPNNYHARMVDDFIVGEKSIMSPNHVEAPLQPKVVPLDHKPEYPE
jgi:hypothetical protein